MKKQYRYLTLKEYREKYPTDEFTPGHLWEGWGKILDETEQAFYLSNGNLLIICVKQVKKEDIVEVKEEHPDWRNVRLMTEKELFKEFGLGRDNTINDMKIYRLEELSLLGKKAAGIFAGTFVDMYKFVSETPMDYFFEIKYCVVEEQIEFKVGDKVRIKRGADEWRRTNFKGYDGEHMGKIGEITKIFSLSESYYLKFNGEKGVRCFKREHLEKVEQEKEEPKKEKIMKKEYIYEERSKPESCYCHTTNPPCSFCVDRNYCENCDVSTWDDECPECDQSLVERIAPFTDSDIKKNPLQTIKGFEFNSKKKMSENEYNALMIRDVRNLIGCSESVIPYQAENIVRELRNKFFERDKIMAEWSK